MTGSIVSRLGTAPEEGVKAPVVVASADGENLTLVGPQTVNGVAVNVGDRVLVRAQTSVPENGIYDVGGPGVAWKRSTDMNFADDVADGVMVVDSTSQVIYQVVVGANWNPGTTNITFPRLLTAGEAQWGEILGTLAAQLDLQSALDAKADDTTVDPHIADATIHFTQGAISITLSQVSDSGTAAALDVGTGASQVPQLDGSGLLPTAVIPPLSITTTYVVANEAAQLALTVQEGDAAVRTDQNKSYLALNSTNASMADWQELLTPTDLVLSVAGKTGAVTLDEADITDLGASVLLNTTDTFTGTLTLAGTLTITTGTQLNARNYVFNIDQALGASEDGYVMTYDDASGELTLVEATPSSPAFLLMGG